MQPTCQNFLGRNPPNFLLPNFCAWYVHAYIQTCTHTYTHTHTHMHTHTCTHMHTHAHKHTFTHIHMHVHTHWGWDKDWNLTVEPLLIIFSKVQTFVCYNIFHLVSPFWKVCNDLISTSEWHNRLIKNGCVHITIMHSQTLTKGYNIAFITLFKGMLGFVLC